MTSELSKNSSIFRSVTHCQRCGAELPEIYSDVSFTSRKLCSSCQISELADVSAVRTVELQSSLGLLIEEAKSQQNWLLRSAADISIGVPSITDYNPSILDSLPNPSTYLGSVLQDVGNIQRCFVELPEMTPPPIHSIAQIVADANLKITDNFSSLLSMAPTIEQSLNSITQSWVNPYMSVELPEVIQQLPSAVSGIVGASLAAETELLGFDSLSLRSIPGITESVAKSSISSLNNMALSYDSLWSDLSKDISSLIAAHAFVIERPPIELYRAGALARLVAPVEEVIVKEEPPEFKRIISSAAAMREKVRAIGEPFVALYDGAIEALKGGEADKHRHVCTSLRELVIHAIHKLAPDNDVVRWASKKYLRDGKPTRRARIQYICRNIDTGSFTMFVNSDVKSALEFIDLLSKGTHSIPSPFTDAQLSALVSRAEGLLLFLADISKS